MVRWYHLFLLTKWVVTRTTQDSFSQLHPCVEESIWAVSKLYCFEQSFILMISGSVHNLTESQDDSQVQEIQRDALPDANVEVVHTRTVNFHDYISTGVHRGHALRQLKSGWLNWKQCNRKKLSIFSCK